MNIRARALRNCLIQAVVSGFIAWLGISAIGGGNWWGWPIAIFAGTWCLTALNGFRIWLSS
jgi:hypothetical protein